MADADARRLTYAAGDADDVHIMSDGNGARHAGLEHRRSYEATHGKRTLLLENAESGNPFYATFCPSVYAVGAG